MHYADNPYISGELHHHIVQAVEHNDELKRIAWQEGREMDEEELVSVANARSSVMLFYANGLNMVRVDMGDTDPVKDWYKPFVEAMMVWAEGIYRDKGCREAAIASARARGLAAEARAAAVGPLLAEIATEGTAGGSAVAQELNRRGVPSPGGGAWYPEQVRRTLRIVTERNGA